MPRALKPGDRVSWFSSGGRSVGRVIRRLTAPMRIKGHKVAASEENPEYLVESDKSHARAAHRPEALRKL